MALYTVHVPGASRPGSDDPTLAGERTKFVREGFSWGAFLLGPLWLIIRRSWLGLLLWCLAMAAAVAAVRFLDLPTLSGVGFVLVIALLFGLEGNSLRRRSLTRRGFDFVALTEGSKREEAEAGFFAHWLDKPAPPPAPVPLVRASWGAPTHDIIGLFSDAGSPR